MGGATVPAVVQIAGSFHVVPAGDIPPDARIHRIHEETKPVSTEHHWPDAPADLFGAAPVVVYGMPDATYHGRPELGSTGVKQARKDPRRIGVSVDKPEFAFGRMVHCAVGEPDEFGNRYAREPHSGDCPGALRTNAEMAAAIKAAAPKVATSGKTKAVLADLVREHCPDAMLWDDIVRDAAKANEGKILVPGYDYRNAERIAEAVRSHHDIQRLGILDGGVAESSWFAPVRYDSPELYGVEWAAKARPDYDKPDGFGGGRITDLKTAKNIGDADCYQWLRSAVNFGYDISAAWYLDVLEACGERRDRWTWIVVDKSTLDDGGPIRVECLTAETHWEMFDNARRKIARALENLHRYREEPEQWERAAQRERVVMWPAWDLKEG